MKIIKTFCVDVNKLYPVSPKTNNKKQLFLVASSLLLCVCFFSGCSEPSEQTPQRLSPHASLDISEVTTIESNLAITSDNITESAVSIIDGGHLTLSDSTIIKTASGGSKIAGDSAPGEPPNPNTAPGALADTPKDGNLTSSPNQTPNTAFTNQDRAPDPSLAPNIPGPPGTPGGAPPDGESGGAPPSGMMATGSDIGSRSSGVYAGSNGKAFLSNVTIETNLEEGKGLCAIGDESSINLTKGMISTSGRSSHGVFATGGGTISLKDVSITTKGEHSSVLATDTGGGKIIAIGGKYTSTGKYSACIYSTGNIVASDATFLSEVDNAAVIEGANKITLTNSSLCSVAKSAVMLYSSSASPSASSEFKMTNGSITSENGPIFYITNTKATVNIKNVSLSSPSGILIKALKGDWGSDVSGSRPVRGGTVDFIADEQTLGGDIVLDENSSITAVLKNKSKFKGSVNTNNKGKKMNLMIDASSTWEVTADSFLNALILPYEIQKDSISNIFGNGHTIYYDKSASSSTLDGKTYSLANGGKLQPK